MSQDKRAKFNAQITEEASEWFIEFRLGEIDATARRDFDAWIRTSPEHLRAYLEIAALWNEGGSLSVHRDLDSEALIALAGTEGNVVPLDLEPQQVVRKVGASDMELKVTRPAPKDRTGPKSASQVPGKTRRLSPHRLATLAAGLAIFVLGGATIVFWQLDHAAVYATSVRERRILRLEDGSTVELNSRSRIRVGFSKDQRNVDLLEGQALFHVAKDAHRPFIVRSDQLRVRAVGTQFDVNRKTTGTTVTVVEGRVAVYRGTAPEPGTANSPSAADNSAMASEPAAAGAGLATLRPAGTAAIVMSAGEQLTVNDPTAPITQPLHASASTATAWTEGQLVLEAVTLTDVAEEFNRYSTRHLTVEDHGESPLRLSGVFATDPDFLLRYLRQRPDITIEESATEVRIIRHD